MFYRLWDARTLSVTQTYVKKQQILTSCDISGNSVITSSGGMNGSGCEITVSTATYSSMLQLFLNNLNFGFVLEPRNCEEPICTMDTQHN